MSRACVVDALGEANSRCAVKMILLVVRGAYPSGKQEGGAAQPLRSPSRSQIKSPPSETLNIRLQTNQPSSISRLRLGSIRGRETLT